MDLLLMMIPVARAGVLLRKRAGEVYEAFVNPADTTQFWFISYSGKLDIGKFIRWDWEMYGVSTMVDVMELDPGKHILVEWDVDKNPTKVEWIFTARTSNTTFVSITNSGFSRDGDQIFEQGMESAAVVGLVLAGLIAYIEYGVRLNLVEGRFPDQLVNPSVSMR